MRETMRAAFADFARRLPRETRVRLLGTSFQLIGERPELQELLRGDPAAIPNFVEECLRYESPVKGDFRLARVSTKVGGVRIPAGTIVMVVNGAANHDARKFSAPKEFQPDRSNARQHLAFGRGIHTCPGGPLARAEGRVSLATSATGRTIVRVTPRASRSAAEEQ